MCDQCSPMFPPTHFSRWLPAAHSRLGHLLFRVKLNIDGGNLVCEVVREASDKGFEQLPVVRNIPIRPFANGHAASCAR
jgi:hypothetical protein